MYISLVFLYEKETCTMFSVFIILPDYFDDERSLPSVLIVCLLKIREISFQCPDSDCI